MRVIVKWHIILAAMMFCQEALWGQPSAYTSLLKTYPSEVTFEENRGQLDPAIDYQTLLYHKQVRFMDQGLSIALVQKVEDENAAPAPPKYRQHEAPEPGHWEGLVWNLTFEGAQTAQGWQPYQPQAGVINYLRDRRSATGVKRYAELWYEDLYPGVDLRYYGSDHTALKYDFILAAGQTPDAIELSLAGVDSLTLDQEGQLHIHTAWGPVTEAEPYAYQMINGVEMPVEAQYVLLDSLSFGFVLTDRYHPGYPVVLDPLTLTWGSFLHGAGSDDYVMGIAVDTAGNTYATGYSQTPSFPTTPGVYQATHHASMDVFVTKLSPGGAGLVYSTFVGGSSWEMGYGIEVDEAGRCYLAGFTRSNNLPTRGGFQMTHGGGSIDAFVMGLSANGDSLLFSSYLGGTERDYIYDMRRAADGSLYLTGFTLSTDFPVTSQAYQSSYTGSGDAFVARVAPTGDSLIYNTYLGGLGYELSNAVVIMEDYSVWLMGTTSSPNLPVTPNALQDSMAFLPGHAQQDGFLTHLSPQGDSLYYSTYLGGYESDEVQSMAIAENGDLVIGGMTYSIDFPATSDAYMEGSHPHLGSGDLFITRLDSSGQTIQHSTYVGGSQNEYCKSLIMLDDDQACILGSTRSPNFPLTAGSATLAGGYDAYLVVYNTSTATLAQSHLYGGLYNDYPRSPSSMKRFDEQMRLGITTHSPGMPIAGSTYQTVKSNGVDDTPWLAGIDVGVTLQAQVQALEARVSDEQVELQWQWRGEPQPAYFLVERRTEHELWLPVARQASTAAQHRYAYYDAFVEPGETYYYRITHYDDAGQAHHSQVRGVTLPTLAQGLRLQLVPNPAQDRVNLTLTGHQEQQGLIRIWDNQGRLWGEYPTTQQHQLELDLSTWAAGLYLVNWNVPGRGMVTERLWVQ